jgi:hypothetical protein
LGEPPDPDQEQSFSELTAQLIEQSAALAGEHISARIKTASAWAVRALTLAGAGLAALALGLTFLGVAIGYALRAAPEASRWWICLVVAVSFMFLGACLTILAFRGRGSETKQRGEEAPH